VVELKRPAEDTEAGRENVKRELVNYVEERFDETKYSTIYAIGGIGLSWVAYKIDKSGPPEPELVRAWSGNVISATSYDAIHNIAHSIDVMTDTVRQYWRLEKASIILF
jgi:hypothetical protein